MINKFDITNMNADTISLNTDGGAYPILEYDPEIDDRYTDRPKMQDDGVWPTFDYEGGMHIHIKGAILADDSDDYTTKRHALVNIIRFKPTPRERKMGFLTINFDGETEDWVTDVKLEASSIPRDGKSPNYTEFLLTFFSFTPYFTGADTSTLYYDV